MLNRGKNEEEEEKKAPLFQDTLINDYFIKNMQKEVS